MVIEDSMKNICQNTSTIILFVYTGVPRPPLLNIISL